MSRKRRQKKRKTKRSGGDPQPQPSGRAQTQGDAAPSREPAEAAAGDVGDVDRLMARGNYKAAVRMGKTVHKRLGSAASQERLIAAYLGRIREMLDKGLLAEAEALADLVEGRYPSSRERVSRFRPEIAARLGGFTELVRPLADPSLPREQRAEIEGALRRGLTDPGELAACGGLPAGHPLMEAARAVSRAFDAVTRGPVDEAAVALPQVPRRGPLAPWKWLVRAIAAFHRRDDAACARCLEAIDGDSAPARLVPALEAMLGRGALSGATRRVHALVQGVGGDDAILRRALDELDAAFQQKRKARMLGAIRTAVRECQQRRPELLEPLRQRVSVRASLRDLDAGPVARAIGGRSLHDAAFWRLLARAAESRGGLFEACHWWEHFRRHAVHEGWFAPNGVEEAAVLRRMARLLDGRSADLLAEARAVLGQSRGIGSGYYDGQPPRIVAARERRLDAPWDFFLSPQHLYRLICERDPDPAAFAQWLAWADEHAGWREADAVALRWAEALPEAAKPYLYLTESCEQRNALKKALKYLAEAEARDALNPEVRRARWRLWVATAIRHLKNGKPHLARKDFEAMDGLAQAREGDRPALLAALRCLSALLSTPREEADRWRDAAREQLDGPAADFLLVQLLRLTRLKATGLNFAACPPDDADPGRLAESLARACALGDDAATPFELGGAWAERLEAGLAAEACAPDVSALLTVGEAALRGESHTLAFRLAGVGLSRGGPAMAETLLLRARSLPLWIGERRRLCFEAVAALARRQRNPELLARAMDLARGRSRRRWSFWADAFDLESAPLSPAEADDVVAHERDAQGYPASAWDAGPYDASPFDGFDELDDDELDDDELDEPCNCPDCRRRRGERDGSPSRHAPYLFDVDPYLAGGEDEADDLFPEDLDDDFMDGLELPDLSPLMLKAILEEFQRAAAAGEEADVDRVLGIVSDAVLGSLPRPPRGRRRRKKRR